MHITAKGVSVSGFFSWLDLTELCLLCPFSAGWGRRPQYIYFANRASTLAKDIRISTQPAQDNLGYGSNDPHSG
jgi:hypothetical protein